MEKRLYISKRTEIS
ncbi:unnamed protein product [Cuscuta epithymum]|uniref:Uncharacterized protein n=1 Tax=Cuscuta epithymum TaxID=186058 RepID=A0AAV0DDS3_9ASTE|nr:unnamed protein product [Cuscuta epithymum]